MVVGRAVQIGETLRQLHQRLVDNVGSEQVAQAIEVGVALFIVLLALIYLRGHYSKHARRRRASGKRFRELVRAHRLPASPGAGRARPDLRTPVALRDRRARGGIPGRQS
jgi:hypothetical protein